MDGITIKSFEFLRNFCYGLHDPNFSSINRSNIKEIFEMSSYFRLYSMQTDCINFLLKHCNSADSMLTILTSDNVKVSTKEVCICCICCIPAPEKTT